MLVFDLYDDWTESISSFTCFNRMVLILRGFHLNAKTGSILLKEISKEKKSEFVWPTI